MRRFPGLAAMLLIAACGGGEDRESELSADEDRQLNDAAAMLDEPEDDGAAMKNEAGDESGDE